MNVNWILQKHKDERSEKCSLNFMVYLFRIATQSAANLLRVTFKAFLERKMFPLLPLGNFLCHLPMHQAIKVKAIKGVVLPPHTNLHLRGLIDKLWQGHEVIRIHPPVSQQQLLHWRLYANLFRPLWNNASCSLAITAISNEIRPLESLALVSLASILQYLLPTYFCNTNAKLRPPIPVNCLHLKVSTSPR